jgi:tRNA wybutosine-synthesizing protein 1
MLTEKRKQELEKQGYRVVGNHSAIKICHYCRQSIRGKDVCYKNTFYNIRSWRCVQMTPILDICNLNCQWCWRSVKHSSLKMEGKMDNPDKIIEGCIEAQKEILQGFRGSPTINKKRFEESLDPIHFAISLASEISLYPKLPQFVEELHNRGLSSFFVTNGTNPAMLKKLKNHQPTQLYITLPAPDKETFEKACHPLQKGLWESILTSISMLGDFERGTVRLTLAKDMNLHNPEGYASLLKDADFTFLELKAAMPVGGAQHRMKYEQMPYHHEIKSFAEKLARLTGLKIIDEKKESRVALLAKSSPKDRKLEF